MFNLYYAYFITSKKFKNKIATKNKNATQKQKQKKNHFRETPNKKNFVMIQDELNVFTCVHLQSRLPI